MVLELMILHFESGLWMLCNCMHLLYALLEKKKKKKAKLIKLQWKPTYMLFLNSEVNFVLSIKAQTASWRIYCFSIWWSYSYIPCCYIWVKQKCSSIMPSHPPCGIAQKKGETTTTQLDSRANGQIRPQLFSAALMGGKWAGQREGHTDYSPMFSPNCHTP